ncbi:MAG: glycoside hydrolase family 2 protein, partial [Spirochaetales bacterium]|nr:glycoside hydrolase family 2 protein [Spirochaetales bacterium]
MTKINDNWLFTEDYSKGFDKSEGVRIPHNPSKLPLHYSSPKDYEMVSGYKKTIILEEEDLDKRIFLRFDGVAHIATLYFNGKEIGTHYSGYTSFTYEVTKYIKKGDNEIILKVDSRESSNIPPFGFVIDYLTYSGIYRDVFLIKKNKSYIKDVFVSTPTLSSIHAEYDVDSDEEYSMEYEILDGEIVIEKGETKEKSFTLSSLSVSPWSPSSPKLYTLRSKLKINGECYDESTTEFGFRTVETKGKDLYLNGERVFLKGLNRHQAWPYIGYAAPERMQRMDARILKEELGCDIVRTSHYPQSQHFISECDKLGLLVFTEIPGWQHIGNKEWKERAIENTKAMVLQYRNHPSIIIWGVRINESQDDDEFYIRTNEVAHTLDPSRPTSGVRYIENSSLLEDIYSYNDFSHTGNNSGVKDKRKVTKHQDKPLLVSEANGHMFPTKAFDPWERRQEHALRHARVINDAKKDGNHIGAIEWCMTDYATHKDFGSGDRICYHGVMDSFRNPKDAAYFWATNQEKNEVLHISSSMDIGDYNGGIRGKIWVFTNAERVDVYKNGRKITSLSSSPFSSLSHGPLVFDDTIGNLLEEDEGFEKKKA